MSFDTKRISKSWWVVLWIVGISGNAALMILALLFIAREQAKTPPEQ